MAEERRAVKTLEAAKESGTYQKEWFKSLHARVAAGEEPKNIVN